MAVGKNSRAAAAVAVAAAAVALLAALDAVPCIGTGYLAGIPDPDRALQVLPALEELRLLLLLLPLLLPPAPPLRSRLGNACHSQTRSR
jgi:hypothetical protein